VIAAPAGVGCAHWRGERARCEGQFVIRCLRAEPRDPAGSKPAPVSGGCTGVAAIRSRPEGRVFSRRN
jgi:hypothetical protein